MPLIIRKPSHNAEWWTGKLINIWKYLFNMPDLSLDHSSFGQIFLFNFTGVLVWQPVDDYVIGMISCGTTLCTCTGNIYLCIVFLQLCNLIFHSLEYRILSKRSMFLDYLLVVLIISLTCLRDLSCFPEYYSFSQFSYSNINLP